MSVIGLSFRHPFRDLKNEGFCDTTEGPRFCQGLRRNGCCSTHVKNKILLLASLPRF
jgi:hypothetical protein